MIRKALAVGILPPGTDEHELAHALAGRGGIRNVKGS
jgi:hypothetical protein